MSARTTHRLANFALWGSCLVFIAGCGGGQASTSASTSATDGRNQAAGDAGADDQSRCAYKGQPDREISEIAGPGSVRPNVRRVYQLVGTGDARHKVLICREIDTNLDGIKDIVRTYSEKGESLHEEADSNYDGRIDTWITFSGGRISKEQLDTDNEGQPDTWKYYVGGQLSRVQRDTNRDGKADRWEFYTSGKLERIGVDLDFDGHVDRWDHDELARAAEEAQAAKSAATAPSSQTMSDAGAAGALSRAVDAGATDSQGADAGSGAARSSTRKRP